VRGRHLDDVHGDEFHLLQAAQDGLCLVGAQAPAHGRAGAGAAVAFAHERLRGLFGSAIDRHFVKGAFTRWGRDPWTRGARRLRG